MRKCNCIKEELTALSWEWRWRSALRNADIPRAASLTFVFASQAPGAPEKQAIHFRSKSLGWIPSVHGLERKVLSCVLELPAREDSYLFWQRFSGMRPCLVGIFSRFDSLGPANTQLLFHRTSLILRPLVFLSSIHRSNTVCSQQVWTSWTSKGGHSFCSALLSHFYCVQFPSPYPSPQRITSSLFVLGLRSRLMCFSILQDIFFRRDKTEADRGAGLGSSVGKWRQALKEHTKNASKETQSRHSTGAYRSIQKSGLVLRKISLRFFSMTHLENLISLFVGKESGQS